MGLEVIDLRRKLRFLDDLIHLFIALHFVNGSDWLPYNYFISECYSPSLVGPVGDDDSIPVPSFMGWHGLGRLKRTLRVIYFDSSESSTTLVVALGAHFGDVKIEFNGVLSLRGSWGRLNAS